MSAHVVTANGLRDGEVLYLAAGGRWTRDLAEAATADGDAAEAALMAIAEQAERSLQIVAPYAMAVAAETEGLSPLSQRERIRAWGPSVGTDLGSGGAL